MRCTAWAETGCRSSPVAVMLPFAAEDIGLLQPGTAGRSEKTVCPCLLYAKAIFRVGANPAAAGSRGEGGPFMTALTQGARLRNGASWDRDDIEPRIAH